MRGLLVFLVLTVATTRLPAPPPVEPDPFAQGRALDLHRVIPANERGIVCLARDRTGRIYGGTTGRAAHFFVYDPSKDLARSLVRMPGGIGLSYALIALPDGSLIAGTQADPTDTAVTIVPREVGTLIRFTPSKDGTTATAIGLGVPVPGQGIYTLAYDEGSQTIVGNTWPDGHFFSYDLKTGKFTDHGTIAGHRGYEEPRHADDLSKGTKEKIFYPRQVSRAIAVVPKVGAFTGGAGGHLYRFDFQSRTVAKLPLRLPAVAGREAWASLDAAAVIADAETWEFFGGTSDGHLFELRLGGDGALQLRPRGRPLGQPTIQALAARRLPRSASGGEKAPVVVHGVGGHSDGMPRGFTLRTHGGTAGVLPAGIPLVDGQHSMVGFGALIADGAGTLWAGERDRIGRLVRFGPLAKDNEKKRKTTPDAPPLGKVAADDPPKLPCRVVFAPLGTTTDGSGYTAISVGLDGNVYVGASRYGGYAWLLVFDPRTGAVFMERVVSMQQLTGERLRGISTQGKIHAIVIVGPDGRIWFASKQAHEIFGTRPEYGEDPEGYPGGHLCYYDPKTGFSRSVGILKKQEGLMAGAMDKTRNKLYYRSEPKNIFLSYEIDTGVVKEHGHIGANCRYMAIDKDGAVYQPGRGDYLARFDPATGYVEDLHVKREGPGHYAAPYVIQLGPNGKLYGAGISHPWILEYDIANYTKGPFPEVTVRNVAPAAPPGMPVFDIHAGVFGKDARFYYPLVTSSGDKKRSERHLRIMRFDPANAKTETVGIPDPQVDESKVKHAYVRSDKYALDYIQGAAVGADGTLFLMDIYPQLNVAMFPKLTAPR